MVSSPRYKRHHFDPKELKSPIGFASMTLGEALYSVRPNPGGRSVIAKPSVRRGKQIAEPTEPLALRELRNLGKDAPKLHKDPTHFLEKGISTHALYQAGYSEPAVRSALLALRERLIDDIMHLKEGRNFSTRESRKAAFYKLALLKATLYNLEE